MAFNPQQLDQFFFSLVFHLVENGADSTTVPTGGVNFDEDSIAPFLQVAFFGNCHDAG